MNYNFHLKKFENSDKNPDKLAIAGSDGDINWTLLKLKVEELQTIFNKLNIPKGHPVIIYGHKETLFPIAILASLHSEITYVPIDVIFPVERIKKIAELTGSQIIINCSKNNIEIDFPIEIHNDLSISKNSTPEYNKRTYNCENDTLQYIIFTSGSTGEPKGVQITNTSILTFIKWIKNDFNINENDVIMSQALYTFDLSMWDFFVSMTCGLSLILMPSEVLSNQEKFLERISHYKCTIWSSTPSFAFLFFRNLEFNSDHLNFLKKFYLMGETLSPDTVLKLKLKFLDSSIYNAYGPTEATIITTCVEITNDVISKYPSLPIGYPMPGSEILIDKQDEVNNEGEIIIVGDHVSVGYLNNEELNKQKFFIYNGKRAFKTGDIGYYEKGMLFFKSRNDDQIKLHGFRIELSEITNIICKNKCVSNAITLPLKRNNEIKKIVSFITTDKTVNDSIVLNELTTVLKEQLPQYMIPGDITVVDEFPYNASHKIDKNKLINDYLNKMLQ